MRVYKENVEDTFEYWGNVTDIFQDYLGNIVKFAKILLGIDYGINDFSKEDAEREADKIEKYYTKNKILLCDANRVVITFKNDKSIEFRNSEWGSIRGLKEK